MIYKMESIYNLKIFSWIDRDIITRLVENLEKEIYLSWQFILNQWDKNNSKWYIIISWEVDVFIDWKNIWHLWAWEVFWEIALLNEEDRTATVIAATDLELLVITQEAIFQIMSEDNSLNKEIMRRVQENTLK